MTDEEVKIESSAGVLVSGISRSSAIMMESAYLVPNPKKSEESGAPFFRTLHVPHDEEVPGPDARIYITKLSNRTPAAVVKKILYAQAVREHDSEYYDFYTFILYINMQLDEPSTTRFINAMVSLVIVPPGKIISFSPREKEGITKTSEAAGDRIFISPALEFGAPLLRYGGATLDDPERRFEIYVGPEEKTGVVYQRDSGYSFLVPKYELLEYEGMQKNDHEVSFELYPPMPPNDSDSVGKGKHAIVSLIVQVRCNSVPEIHVSVTGKVKGEIWGVVPVKGQVDFSACHFSN